MDVLTREQRRRNMQANKSTGTRPEQLLSKKLWHKGFRYTKNDRRIVGRPDIVFKKLKIAIFCDGEFWHGKNWEEKKQKIAVNRHYWVNKIERNVERDIAVNNALRSNGWCVLRFWSKEILRNLEACAETVEVVILQRRNENV